MESNPFSGCFVDDFLLGFLESRPRPTWCLDGGSRLRGNGRSGSGRSGLLDRLGLVGSRGPRSRWTRRLGGGCLEHGSSFGQLVASLVQQRQHDVLRGSLSGGRWLMGDGKGRGRWEGGSFEKAFCGLTG